MSLLRGWQTQVLMKTLPPTHTIFVILFKIITFFVRGFDKFDLVFYQFVLNAEWSSDAYFSPKI